MPDGLVSLWCFKPLLNFFHLHCGGQFYLWRKPEYPEKTTDLSQVTDKFYQVHLSMNGVRTHNCCSYDRRFFPKYYLIHVFWNDFMLSELFYLLYY